MGFERSIFTFLIIAVTFFFDAKVVNIRVKTVGSESHLVEEFSVGHIADDDTLGNDLVGKHPTLNDRHR